MSATEATRFAECVRPFLEASLEALEQERKGCIEFGAQPDWPWVGFVQSFATLGGSNNLNRIQARKSDFEWNNVCALSDDDRKRLFLELPNPRFRDRVASFVEQVFHRFRVAGGPAAIRREYEAAGDRVAYLRTFPGIGEKYARNIPMDICDPVVTKRFALDHRLKRLLFQHLQRHFNYQEGEDFLNEVARLLGTDSSSLDRVLYAQEKEIEEALRSRAET